AVVQAEPVCDQGVVVWPDRAVVVRERVVARVAARHRAHGPAAPKLPAHTLIDDRITALPGHDPAPEQVADVRAERVDLPLLPVEREHVVAAARVGPEAFGAGSLLLLRLALEPLRERPVAPDLARQL